MATRFSSTLLPDCSTDANFQAWAKFIEDTLVTTGGWVITSDTGQTAPTSLVHPTTVNTKKGYRIYRMADTLQATYPVFMRIDFGSSAGAAIPGIWVTIGTGSDGAGNITGKLWDGGSSTSPVVYISSSSTTPPFNSYGSADTNRASFALFVYNGTIYQMVFTIERTKDTNGNDTGDGLLLVYRDPSVASTAISNTRYLYYAGGVQPTTEAGLSYVLTSRNPSETFGGDIGVGIVIHFRGVSQQPGTNVMIVNSSDVSAEGQVALTLYGSTRTYQHLNALQSSKALAGSITADANARCMIRYD